MLGWPCFVRAVKAGAEVPDIRATAEAIPGTNPQGALKLGSCHMHACLYGINHYRRAAISLSGCVSPSARWGQTSNERKAFWFKAPKTSRKPLFAQSQDMRPENHGKVPAQAGSMSVKGTPIPKKENEQIIENMLLSPLPPPTRPSRVSCPFRCVSSLPCLSGSGLGAGLRLRGHQTRLHIPELRLQGPDVLDRQLDRAGLAVGLRR